MGSMNKAIICGYVGKDPEIRSAQSGRQIANLSIATSESWTDKASGEKREKTEWHRVVCFNDHVTSIIEKWVKKGSLILVEGALRTRKWQAQDGSDRYSTEIHIEAFAGGVTLLTSPRDDAGGGQARGGASSSGSRVTGKERDMVSGAGGGSGGWDDGGRDLDDEIPF